MGIKRYVYDCYSSQIISLEQLEDSYNLEDINGVSTSVISDQNPDDDVWIYADYEHPLVLNYGILDIDPQYYLENKKQLDQIIENICIKSANQDFNLGGNLLNFSQIISLLCANKNVQNITFLNDDPKSAYYLTYEDYLKFKVAGKKEIYCDFVDDKVKQIYDDPMLTMNLHQKIFGSISYTEFQSSDVIFLNSQVNDDEWDNIKYAKDKLTIYVTSNLCWQIKKLTEKAREHNKNIKFVVHVKNIDQVLSILDDINYENVYVQIEDLSIKNSNIQVKKFIELNTLIDEFIIKPALPLSPFEKYIYAYNIVKWYKKFANCLRDENNYETIRAPRDVFAILENEYIVCVGFANFFGLLLHKFGLNSIAEPLIVDLSYDNANEEVTKIVTKEGHCRRYTYIVDEKYQIDGYYHSDPTWDNDLDADLYNYLAFTDREATMAMRYEWFEKTNRLNLIQFYMPLFNVTSLEEFYHLFEYYISIGVNKLDIMRDLATLLSKFNPNFFKSYQFADTLDLKDDNYLSNFLEVIGLNIVCHVNKEISGETILHAVESVYDTLHVYDDQTKKIVMQEIYIKNKLRQEEQFPRRYKIYAEGTTEDYYDNYHNKFDIDVENYRRKC